MLIEVVNHCVLNVDSLREAANRGSTAASTFGRRVRAKSAGRPAAEPPITPQADRPCLGGMQGVGPARPTSVCGSSEEVYGRGEALLSRLVRLRACPSLEVETPRSRRV